MKSLLILLLIFTIIEVNGQINKSRPIVWVIPAVDTKISGLAAGLLINYIKDEDSILTTVINGISLEIVGAGIILPLAPDNPIYVDPDDYYLNKSSLDSIITSFDYVKYRINGLSLSAGGIGGHDININGLNLSGLNTLTGKMNGLSICILFNFSDIVNGVSIGGLMNNTIQTKGLQIGLYNRTTRLRGFQIGLWNKNEKRSLPIINWNFN